MSKPHIVPRRMFGRIVWWCKSPGKPFPGASPSDAYRMWLMYGAMRERT
jgi:hypothetical protein